jgi:hypothetical protein
MTTGFVKGDLCGTMLAIFVIGWMISTYGIITEMSLNRPSPRETFIFSLQL